MTDVRFVRFESYASHKNLMVVVDKVISLECQAPSDATTINFHSGGFLVVKGTIEEVAAKLMGEENDWQSIETAPKDGSFIMGWYKGWETPILCRYLTGKGLWNTTMQPTHWTNLPVVPEWVKQEAQANGPE